VVGRVSAARHRLDVLTEIAIRDEQQYLAVVREVRALAERCDSVEGAKNLADRAAAMKVYAERAKLGGDMVNRAAAAKLWAERRAGELLAVTVRPGNPQLSSTPTVGLAELGVTRDQSSRWQDLAEVPVDEFEQAIEEAAETGKVTSSKVVSIARRKATVEDPRLSAEESDQHLTDLRLFGLINTALAKTAPLRTALDRTVNALERADRDRLQRYAETCQAHADVMAAIANRARLLLQQPVRRAQ
jgi:hypothetical protein